MVDEPTRSKELEAAINRLEGVARSILLVGPGGEPVEAQIFYHRGTSVPRIRRGVEALLLSLGKPLSSDEIAVFELEPEPTAAAPIPAVVTIKEAPKPPRAIPVTSLATTLLAVLGLMLLLTAPWVALVRLITEPLRTSPVGQRVQVVSPSGSASDDGLIRVAVPAAPETAAPTAAQSSSTSPRPAAVAGVRITAPASSTSAAPQPQVAAVPQPAAPTVPVLPVVTPTPPAGRGESSPPPNKPHGVVSGDEDDDEDCEGDDRRFRKHHRHKHHHKAVLKGKAKGHGHHRKSEKARRNDDDDRGFKQNDDDCDD